MSAEDKAEEIRKAYKVLAEKIAASVEPEEHPVVGKSLDLMKLPWDREV